MQGIYKLMKFRYLFWLYWKIQQAARYKSLNPHWETDRGTEITLSETSSHTIFFFFFSLTPAYLQICHLLSVTLSSMEQNAFPW